MRRGSPPGCTPSPRGPAYGCVASAKGSRNTSSHSRSSCPLPRENFAFRSRWTDSVPKRHSRTRSSGKPSTMRSRNCPKISDGPGAPRYGRVQCQRSGDHHGFERTRHKVSIAPGTVVCAARAQRPRHHPPRRSQARELALMTKKKTATPRKQSQAIVSRP